MVFGRQIFVEFERRSRDFTILHNVTDFTILERELFYEYSVLKERDIPTIKHVKRQGEHLVSTGLIVIENNRLVRIKSHVVYLEKVSFFTVFV